MPITTRQLSCTSGHFVKGADGRSLRKAIRDVNDLWLAKQISYDKASRIKSDILSFVVISHRAVVANLFKF